MTRYRKLFPNEKLGTGMEEKGSMMNRTIKAAVGMVAIAAMSVGTLAACGGSSSSSDNGKGKVYFLGSSFAFIAPIIAATKQWGLPGTIAGLTSVSLVYFIMSALVKWQGKKLLDRIFPPVVIGPAIILIGLSLSGSAVDMAKANWILAFSSLITAILVLTFCKGLMKLVPIITGVVVGYIIAICMGEVDFSGIAAA